MGIYPIHNLKSQVCKNEEVSAESRRLLASFASFIFFYNFAKIKKKQKNQNKIIRKTKYKIRQT